MNNDRFFPDHPFYHEYAGLTFDVDWASDAMLEHVISIIKSEGLKATFFATHKTPVLENLDPEQFEIGLHPNFRGKLDYDNIVKELKEVYPGAIGARSHGLYFGSDVLSAYLKSGLRYESNYFLYGMANLHPVRHCVGILQVPYTWDDQAHMEYHKPWNWDSFRFNVPGLKIFNFHPVYVYYNISVSTTYHELKKLGFPLLSQPDQCRTEGVREMFLSLVRTLKQRNMKTFLMREVLEKETELIS